MSGTGSRSKNCSCSELIWAQRLWYIVIEYPLKRKDNLKRAIVVTYRPFQHMEPCRIVLETNAETGRGVHFSRRLSEARWAELRAESAQQESDNRTSSSSGTDSSESDSDSASSKSSEGATQSKRTEHRRCWARRARLLPVQRLQLIKRRERMFLRRATGKA